ncbi:MAG: protein translocase subunit SecD [Myxococcota bacterium]
MERSWYWRMSTVVGLMILAVYYVAPSVLYFFADPDVRRDEDKLSAIIPDWLPEQRLSLGIDLQGGLYLVMGVDTTKAVLDRADRVCDELSDSMEEKGKPLAGCTRDEEAPMLTIEVKDAGDWSVLKELLDFRSTTWSLQSRSGVQTNVAMIEDYEVKLREDTVDQALRTLPTRIQKSGLMAGVKKNNNDSIVIQIPGVTADDYEKLKEEIIGKTAQLEFKLVDSETTFFQELSTKADKPESVELSQDTYVGPNDALVTSSFLVSQDKLELRAFVDKYPPPKDRVVGIQENKAQDGTLSYRTWLLERRTPLTGDALTDAFEQFDPEEGGYHVTMKFDRKGAVAFEKLTGDNVKRRMAIVLDDVVDSAPVIQGRIAGGNARITMNSYGTQSERLAQARALAIVLKAGALPAPVYPREERTVGATLGDDAVVKGKNALMVAIVLVFALMVFYYRGTGAVGTAALSVNLLFLFAGLSAFGATLTLPGIAGLALTVGMAVDANIIQFERIREELALGKTVRAAVDAGFDKAFSAIFDANVTTFLAAVILQGTGSGPIKGFGVTLMMGVFINTFTAIVVPRLILDYFTRGRRVQELSI